MSEAYDLFQKSEIGEPGWIETVIGLSNLKNRAANLLSIRPPTYMVCPSTEREFFEPAQFVGRQGGGR
jgi:hypothetical protein